MRTPLIVLNRRAGRVAPRAVSSLERLARSTGAALSDTVDYEEGRRLAAAAASGGSPLVVAAGGDGTVQSVVSGLLDGALEPAARPRLAIVPLGRGNDLACALGCRADAAGIAALADMRAERPLDVGQYEVDGRSGVFVNSVGLGIEAEVAGRARRIPLPGIGAYLVAAVATLLAGARPARVDGTLDGEPVSGVMIAVSVGNSPTTGGGFRLTPHGAPGSGTLAWCTMAPARRASLFALLPRALYGRHLSDPRVLAGTARELVFDFDPPLTAHADGEPLGPPVRRASLRILPAALTVVLPGPR